MLKKQPRLFWVGLLLYVASFFLPTFVDSFSEPTPGWWWALAAIALPISWRLTAIQPGHAFANSTLAYESLIVGGLINPVFLAAVAVRLFTQYRLAFAALKVSVVAMIVFSWIALADMLLVPREGHVAWVAGMLIALFMSRPKTALIDLGRPIA